MGSKNRQKKNQARAQRRKRKEDRRRQRKEKETRKVVSDPIGLRLKRRISERQPVPWPGEQAVDVAVWDAGIRETLDPPELREEVELVVQALSLVEQRDFSAAEARMSSIGRKSPASQWRMLIRGLVAWYSGDYDDADRAWQRLDPERRPWRIAQALQLARCEQINDLAQAALNGNHSQDEEADGEIVDPRNDLAILGAAKLVRQIRIARPAVRIARSGLKQDMDEERRFRSDENLKDLLIGPVKIKWIADFASDFRSVEPGLVQAIEAAALSRAFNQVYIDVFEIAIQHLRGPRHDPDNLLLQGFYRTDLEDIERGRFFSQYKEFLVADKTLPKTLRQAMISEFHFRNMESLMQSFSGPFRWDRDVRDEVPGLEDQFILCVEAYPANKKAYETLANWLESEMDWQEYKEDEKLLEQSLAGVMERWCNAFPEEFRPRMFLANWCLENELTEGAKIHVDKLMRARPDDLRLRALPWKQKMIEASSLARRKNKIDESRRALDEAKQVWPVWLEANWLPYFKAAASLRVGDQQDYEAQRAQIVVDQKLKRDSLLDACRMLGAAQRMRVPGKDLKPLRAPIDAALKQLESISTGELIEVGAFFWNTMQAEFSYPAYRNHGAKLGRELLDRLEAASSSQVALFDEDMRLSKHLSQVSFQQSILWLSEQGLFRNGSRVKFPGALEDAMGDSLMLSLAYLNAASKIRNPWINDAVLDDVEQLAEHSDDPFLNYLANELLQKLEDDDDDYFPDMPKGFAEAFADVFGS